MSKINSYIMDWVADGGGELGYDMDRLPRMRDMDWILERKVCADMYFGYSEYPDTMYEFLRLTGGLPNAN